MNTSNGAENDHDYTGNDLQYGVKVDTGDECEALCESHPLCTHITLQNGGLCYLKTSSTGRVSRSGFISTVCTYTAPTTYGAQCRCPNGQVYSVGDHDDKCGSTACYGGEILGECSLGGVPSQSAGAAMKCSPHSDAANPGVVRYTGVDLAEKQDIRWINSSNASCTINMGI